MTSTSRAGRGSRSSTAPPSRCWKPPARLTGSSPAAIIVSDSLGIILKAKSAGLIPAARPELERLVEHGMYLSGRVLDQALALVGE
ncbi:MAG TPA: DUF3368 domain-containing protein [Thermoanaerobaculia bacterium]|nr:DUF3368 domain-containing protein [Thermoanaerobaculia bacterium]